MDLRWRQARNILVVRLDHLGDVLLCVPAFRAIKQTQPEARLTLLASSFAAEVVSICPYLDDVIVYDSPWMDNTGTLPQDTEREVQMVRLLRERRFDGAIIFTSYHQSSLPAALLCYMAGIPLRHAASVDFPGTLLTSRHRHPATLMHEVERALDLVSSIGFHTSCKDMELRVPEETLLSVERKLTDHGIDLSRPLVVIHPGGTAQSRRYPWECYARVADLLAGEHGMQVVFTGSASEVALVEKVLAAMQQPAWSLAGQTSLAELAAVVQVADLLITNNTGPQHVASSVKTPVVVVFALTNRPQQWGPWMVPHRTLNYPTSCAICYQFVCPTDHACLRLVRPEQVRDAALAVLAEAAESGRAKRRGLPAVSAGAGEKSR